MNTQNHGIFVSWTTLWFIILMQKTHEKQKDKDSYKNNPFSIDFQW